jgi:NAD dependent epimerase/dehydratase family enzyme
MLKMMLGEMAGALLEGQRAVPSGLTAAGFQFTYPKIDGALNDLLSRI